MSVNDIKFSRLTFTYASGDVYKIAADFQYNGVSLAVSGYNQPDYGQFVVNFDTSGSDNLDGDITFSAQLSDPAPNPEVQNAVDIKFYDISTDTYSSKKGNDKIGTNQCPPPGQAATSPSGNGNLLNYNTRIKAVDLVRTGGTTQVTVTTENTGGGSTGYRIISNTEHIIQTTGGDIKTWAFEIQNGNKDDINNTFDFDFSSVDAEVGLPILFYEQGTSINSIDESDALLWVEQ